MSTYNQVPIRLEADLISLPPVVPIDQNTGQPIQFWRAQAIQVAIGIFDADGNSVDLSNLESLQLVIQEAQNSLVPSIVKTVSAGSIIPTISRAEWDANENQQALIDLSAAETDLGTSGTGERTYWMYLVGHPTGGGNIVYAAGPVRVFNPGGSLPTPVPPTSPLTSWNAQGNSSGSSVVTPGSQFHSEKITVTGAARTSDIVVGVAGLSAGAQIGIRFILPATAGINLRIFDQAISGTLLTTVETSGGGFLPSSLIELRYDGTSLERWSQIQPSFGQQS